MENEITKIEHEGKVYIFPFLAAEVNAKIETHVSSEERLRLSGFHYGDPIEVRVVNPHWDGDCDESGSFYSFTFNLVWHDTGLPCEDEIWEYSDAISDAIKDKY
jgi:hypothetical protein